MTELFAGSWAVAALLHVWAHPASAGFTAAPTWTGLVHVLLAFAALAVLLSPGRRDRLVVLCGLQVLSAAMELPRLGNHWLLAALVSAAVVTTRDFAAPARLVLLTAYSFMAFSKLNTGFLDPAVSCGRFFADELGSSYGLPTPGTGAVPYLTAAVECAIPVLLLVRRTRAAGVLLGLAFHGLISLDRTHLFTDFSAVLYALFPLFLAGVPDRRPRTLLAAAGLLVGFGLWTFPGEWARSAGLLWWLVAAVPVAAAAVRHRAPAALGRPHRGLMVLPVLALLNGLTPYLEVKTAFGWNMYANLRTVAGRSNHLLVPATLPLSGAQRHLVEVISSGDPALGEYAATGYLLAVPQLRAYARIRPGSDLTYRLDGAEHHASRLAGDPVLGRPLPWWRERLLPLRAVDPGPGPRCQSGWGAAG
ncbi:hypothetical protein [Actinocorallia longicatena]|uniref:HTTM domain-containing protein n=1 Tax=Actinocorallia longicatena TaxID=111803 RepID=A0ABP6QGB0_9ACTN